MGQATTFRTALARRPSPRLMAAAVAAFALLGLILTRQSISIPATRWMNIFEPSDFPTLASLGAFLTDLRVPIPPLLAAAEALSYQLTRSTELVTVVGYRAAMIGSYLLALVLAARTRWRLLLSFGAGLLFLWGTVQVHPFNPQVYDVVFPAFVLLWIACLGWGAQGGRWSLGLALASGMFLALAELTRPFFLILLPLALAGSLAYLARTSRRLALALIVPVVVVSGGWHAHMLIDHGQIFWSNHGGFNLAHAWRQAGIVPPTLVPEPGAPLAPGRWENLNTDAHTENSERWTRAVLRYAAAHPAGALTLALSRVSIYLLGPVPSEAMGIPPAALGLYRWAMAVGLVYLVVELVTGTALLISDRLPALRVWSLPGGLVVLIGSGSLVLQALGSAVEEARMVLALLPLVAALPGIGAGDYLEGRAIASARVGGGLILAAVFVLVLSIVWDPLRGVPFALSGRQLAAAAVATGLVLKGLILRSPGLDSS